MSTTTSTGDLYTVSAAARLLGMSPQRVAAICLEHGIGRVSVSVRRRGGVRVLTAAEVESVASHRRPRGNPGKAGKAGRKSNGS